MHDPRCAVVRHGDLRAWCDCGYDRPFNAPPPIVRAINLYWGERCDEYDPDCPTCEAWRQYDELNGNYIPPVAVDIAKRIASIQAAASERRRLHDLLEQLLETGLRPKAANLIRKELDAWREPDEEDD